MAAAGVLLGLGATAPTESPLRVTNVRVAQANIVMTVSLPEEVRDISVESAADLVDASWRPVPFTLAETADGLVRLTVPQPDSRRYFRIRTMPIATPTTERVARSSTALAYVAARPVEARKLKTGELVFELNFALRLDGSDRIRITRKGVVWGHVNWDWPHSAVQLNDLHWQPAEQNVMTVPEGMSLLPDKCNFSAARVSVKRGRDMVVLERGADAIVVHVNDTPVGADDYEFTITIPATIPAPPAKKSHVNVVLPIVARIDGSDRLLITQERAEWQHGKWKWPTNVTIGGVAWQPETAPVLTNTAGTAFLTNIVDFSSVRILNREARDTCVVESTPTSTTIYFADNPNGADRYAVELGFSGK